jgi:hypothetical protein
VFRVSDPERNPSRIRPGATPARRKLTGTLDHLLMVPTRDDEDNAR